MSKALLLLCSVLAAARLTSSAEIPLDWMIPANGMPYPTELINVGDSIMFNWMGGPPHGVYEVTTPACPEAYPDGPAELAGVAPMGSYVWTAQMPGTYYFACQVGNHCAEGMLVTVIVGDGAALTPGAEAPMAPFMAPMMAPMISAGEDSDGDGDGM